MRILITGGTGFVGQTLVEHLVENGHQATVLTRSSRTVNTRGVTFLPADPCQPGPWQEEAARHEAVINLAGASIFGRWTPARKNQIRESRILTTRNLAQALASIQGRQVTLVSASGIGYYGFTGDRTVDESAPAGKDFLARMAADWEQEALAAGSNQVRVVLCRFGLVLGKRGGTLKKMLTPSRLGLASPLGSGNQWFPWIHESDLARVVLFLLEHTELAGAFNCTAPEPVSNRDFTRTLGQALGRPSPLPAVPAWVLRAALGEFAEVLLEGQRALPARLQEQGFQFRYPDLRTALGDLLRT